MPKLTIDNRPVEVEPGATVLDAARKLGIDIPTLCFLEGRPAQTSCMACLVKVNGQLVPACATIATNGMRVESETDEVHGARRTALELLLGDHLGDCVAPCQAVCPSHINIPRIIRQVASGRIQDGVPAVEVCRTCRAPCEKACRRAVKDHAVSIRLLLRYAAEVGRPVAKPPAEPAERPYSVHVGRIDQEEIDLFMVGASEADRVEPSRGPDAGFTDDEARREALRCLHCDCRRADDCKLRNYGALCEASPRKHKVKRRRFEQQCHPQNVIYEPGKCIACGLCVQITKDAGESLGLTFVGRGFNVRVAVPFNRPLAEGLRHAAAECVRACPTGALAFKDDPQET